MISWHLILASYWLLIAVQITSGLGKMQYNCHSKQVGFFFSSSFSPLPLPFFFCSSHPPFLLVQERKVFCIWSQGHDHIQHTDHSKGWPHILLGKSQRPVQITVGHCPNGKEHFFPRSLLRILYNHTCSSLSRADIHSQREKLIPEYWVINYMRYISL